MPPTFSGLPHLYKRTLSRRPPEVQTRDSVGGVPRAARPAPTQLTRAIAQALSTKLAQTGLSQRHFAPIVGISDSQLSKHLRGEVTLTIDLLDLICHELGLSLVEVVDAAEFQTRDRWQPEQR